MRADLDDVIREFRDRAEEERRRFEAATDSEYWCALVFETRAQKEAFLQAMGWLALGDKYLDGVLIARQEGVELPAAQVPYVTTKPDAKLNEITRPATRADRSARTRRPGHSARVFRLPADC